MAASPLLILRSLMTLASSSLSTCALRDSWWDEDAITHPFLDIAPLYGHLASRFSDSERLAAVARRAFALSRGNTLHIEANALLTEWRTQLIVPSTRIIVPGKRLQEASKSFVASNAFSH